MLRGTINPVPASGQEPCTTNIKGLIVLNFTNKYLSVILIITHICSCWRKTITCGKIHTGDKHVFTLHYVLDGTVNHLLVLRFETVLLKTFIMELHVHIVFIRV